MFESFCSSPLELPTLVQTLLGASGSTQHSRPSILFEFLAKVFIHRFFWRQRLVSVFKNEIILFDFFSPLSSLSFHAFGEYWRKLHARLGLVDYKTLPPSNKTKQNKETKQITKTKITGNPLPEADSAS